MAVKHYNTDSIASLLGAMGDPTRDKAAGTFYLPSFVTDDQLLNAYRGSWLPRKIVNIPAMDSVRQWREWKADKATIELIENRERALNVTGKILEARTRARLMGGAAVYISLKDDKRLDLPLEPERAKNGGIKYLTVLSRVELHAGPIDVDPMSETFNQPLYYTVGSSNLIGDQFQIHPSRLVKFVGGVIPEPRYNFLISQGWGDSVLLPVFDAIKQSDSTMANVASLIFEANVDAFGVPDFLDQMSDPLYEQKMITRFGLVSANKGINRSILHDAAETFTRNPASFGSLDALIDKFFQAVSGAADIPATRLLGMSPAGMSSTGESDLRNYYDRVKSEQKIEMQPAMTTLDDCLIWDATGKRDPAIYYRWSSLWQLTELDRATIGKTDADTVVALNNTGLFPQEALATAAANQLVEHGIYPDLDTAIEDAGGLPDYEALLQQEHQQTLEQITAKGQATPGKNPMVKDMAPESLYVSRSVLNAAAILKWAKEQGLPQTIEGDALHVTIIYSRAAIDWFKMGASWDAEMKIPAGGPRKVEEFAGGAIVLRFASSELQWRHNRALDLGASSDFEDYKPHITISYQPTSKPFDLSNIVPYQGEIILGPEIFEPLKGM